MHKPILKGCRPEAYWGGTTITGNHAYKLVCSYEKFYPFWREIVSSKMYVRGRGIDQF